MSSTLARPPHPRSHAWPGGTALQVHTRTQPRQLPQAMPALTCPFPALNLPGRPPPAAPASLAGQPRDGLSPPHTPHRPAAHARSQSSAEALSTEGRCTVGLGRRAAVGRGELGQGAQRCWVVHR